MAIKRFKDLPSTDTPINSANLNGNFDELGAKVGTSIDSNYRTNILMGKNLFDKNNFNVLDGLISDGGTLASNQYFRTLFIKCKPSTTYTASKISSSYFRVGGFASVPTLGASYISRIKDDNATSITYTTPSNCNYLAITYYDSNSDNNLQAILDSIQIEKGSTATTYEAYITPAINVDGEDIYSKPVVLWTNPSPTSSFAGQQITLSDSLNNYDYYEVIYYNTNSLTQTFTTGKIKNDKITTLYYFAGLEANTYIAIRYRAITSINASEGKIRFGDAYNKYTHEQTLTTNNILTIPYKIIGYKE